MDYRERGYVITESLPPLDPSAELSDETLLKAVRAGDQNSYGLLYERYRSMATAIAYKHTSDPGQVDDIVAEAFARVLQALRNGNGPTSFMGGYLSTTIAHLAGEFGLIRGREVPADSTALEHLETLDEAVLHLNESDELIAAFTAMPERWQSVLWLTEVEKRKPRDIANALDISPNAVSALTLRARESLREGFLRAHQNAPVTVACQKHYDRLPALVRGSLSDKRAENLRLHLEECTYCTSEYLSLMGINKSMRVWVFPVLAGLVPWVNDGTTIIGFLGKAATVAASNPFAGAASTGQAAPSIPASDLLTPAGEAVGSVAAHTTGTATPSPAQTFLRNAAHHGTSPLALAGGGLLAVAAVVAGIVIGGGLLEDDPEPVRFSEEAHEARGDSSSAASGAPQESQELSEPAEKSANDAVQGDGAENPSGAAPSAAANAPSNTNTQGNDNKDASQLNETAGGALASSALASALETPASGAVVPAAVAPALHAQPLVASPAPSQSAPFTALPPLNQPGTVPSIPDGGAPTPGVPAAPGEQAPPHVQPPLAPSAPDAGTPTSLIQPEVPTDSVESADPVVPDAPEEPVAPEVPTDPVAPTDPVDPAQPDVPVDPETPKVPTDPVDSIQPVDPEDPTEPVAPSGPADPLDPESPVESNNPDNLPPLLDGDFELIELEPADPARPDPDNAEADPSPDNRDAPIYPPREAPELPNLPSPCDGAPVGLYPPHFDYWTIVNRPIPDTVDDPEYFGYWFFSVPWQDWTVADPTVSKYVMFQFEVDGTKSIHGDWIPHAVVESRYLVPALAYLYGADSNNFVHVYDEPPKTPVSSSDT
ncbi:sigma-70 family RNA polymerase sigma factor [Rothia sp. ZJ932]|uniref:sigma-70 family RNA polymerase sigma factor n=1 Tax=Rothia sp. ZJ932 TaxID=2810516 RepID=UPI001966DF4C|nr:sigma-70 family RNA polymerase sigma factor [Rothia sp. ZJ932]QRZ62018.1 sigma-70 family RNA polymerase sigma factor [Rothia sp. ZJ932]